ncbi:MAG: rhodanese-like domain-containing protein [Candidatus Limnocylindrus sp.]|jgi:rhodanese-related sulfurtransferase
MSRTRRTITVTVLAVAALLSISACGSGSADGGGVRTVAAADAVAVLDSRVVIDVRSPAEVAEGAITGATVLDFNAGEFEAKIGDFDRNAAYLVYCRSGNRSGQAVAIMKELGFTDVIDAGAFSDLKAAGAPTTP